MAGFGWIYLDYTIIAITCKSMERGVYAASMLPAIGSCKSRLDHYSPLHRFNIVTNNAPGRIWLDLLGFSHFYWLFCTFLRLDFSDKPPLRLRVPNGRLWFHGSQIGFTHHIWIWLDLLGCHCNINHLQLACSSAFSLISV
jgi:hypothetical protein